MMKPLNQNMPCISIVDTSGTCGKLSKVYVCENVTGYEDKLEMTNSSEEVRKESFYQEHRSQFAFRGFCGSSRIMAGPFAT